MPLRSALLVAVLLTAGCYGPDPNLTESGKGRPFVSVEFPEEVDAGSTHTATLEIENPGPGDMRAVLVTFSLVGQGGTPGGVPNPIVPTGSDGSNEAIVSIDPEPEGVSQDGIVYRFGSIPEGETMTIEFDIRVPTTRGGAANAVIVSDGDEIDRARGVRLETTIL